MDGVKKAYGKPEDIRLACRSGEFRSQTSGQLPGFAQANLCILPKEYAFDFLLFCQRNPKPCPLLHVLEAGCYNIDDNQTCDIRYDLPKYRVFKDGNLIDEVEHIEKYWNSNMVTFVIGCSFSFEEALLGAGIDVRHIEEGKNVPMYNTSIPCATAGIFSGTMVVSMRPMTPANAIKATQLTARYARVHGAPIHIGDPSAIGIADINKPDYGETVTIKSDEVPVFWACGVTPQAIVMNSKPSLCITHAPGHMLVMDDRNETLSLS